MLAGSGGEAAAGIVLLCTAGLFFLLTIVAVEEGPEHSLGRLVNLFLGWS
jgi:hypothetical protein